MFFAVVPGDDCQRLRITFQGIGITPRFLLDLAEHAQARGHLHVRCTIDSAKDIDAMARKCLGFCIAPSRQFDVCQRRFGKGSAWQVPGTGSTQHLQGIADQCFRFRHFADGVDSVRIGGHGLSRGDAVGTAQCRLHFPGALERRLCRFAIIETDLDLTEILEQLRLQGRIAGKAGVDDADAIADHGPWRTRRCTRPAERILFAEQGQDEILDPLAAGQLQLGLVALAVGAAGLGLGNARLPQRGTKTSKQCKRNDYRGGNAEAVAADELAQAIRGGIGARRDRPRFQPAAQVLGKRRGRRIAPCRFALQGSGDDQIEIAGQVARQVLRIGLRTIEFAQLPGIELRRQRAGAFDDFQAGIESQLRRVRVTPLPRQLPGQQFAQHQAQRVDIGRRADGLAEDLLRCGISRREHAHGGAGAGLLAAFLDQLGNAEIKHARLALMIDQHVGRLEVAMHDQLRMRVGNRIGNLDQHGDARAGIERGAARVLGDRHTIDHIHDVERPSIRGHAAIQQAHDMRMLQPREDASLLQETAQDRVRVHAAFEHFHRHLLLVGAIGALGQPDHAHAAFAKQPQQSIRAGQAIGGHAIAFAVEHTGHGGGGIAIEQATDILVGGQQGAHFLGQFRITCRQLRQSPRALVGIQLDQFVEQGGNLRPAIGRGRHRSGRRHFTLQECARAAPVAFQRALRAIQHIGDLAELEPRVETHFDEGSQRRVDGIETCQGGIEGEHFLAAIFRRRLQGIGVQRSNLHIAAAPERRARTHMVDDDLPHHARGNGKEMPAIIDVECTVPGNLQIGLMHQRGRAHHLLTAQLAGGETPQVVVQQDEKALRSRLLAGTGAPHQFGDFTHRSTSLASPNFPHSPLGKPSILPPGRMVFRCAAAGSTEHSLVRRSCPAIWPALGNRCRVIQVTDVDSRLECLPAGLSW